MLVDLRVKNFALIDNLEISFDNGLNVLTGETGAGKSIIIGALEMLLGARASREVVRKNREKAYIEAAFEPDYLEKINNILEDSGIEPDPDILLLSREIKLNGRNRSRINGQLATLGMIRKISHYLVDIHGQHEHQSLLNQSSHLDFLDQFIGKNIVEMKKEIASIYKRIKDIDEKLNELTVDEGEKARQLDLLEFQINEINEADLKIGEEKKLQKKYQRLANMEEIFSTVGIIYNNIDGEDFNASGVLDQIGEFMKKLEEIKDYDDVLAEYYQEISDIYYKLQDLSFQLRDYHGKLEYDQKEMERFEERLDLINKLQKKYGDSIKEILKYRDEMVEKKEKLLSQEKNIKKLKSKKKKLKNKFYKKAKNLSKVRKKYSNKLEDRISQELKDLAMEDVVFSVNFAEKNPSKSGVDRIEFLISPNPGEELKPLAKIASGGELSRIMLALKTIIADTDRVDTLIFDEVDSGVGGKTAQKMAEKLACIGSKRQVICITHLPQIASMSDNHFFITKKTENKRTYTQIYELDEKGKKEELARMLGGVKLTDTTLKHAREMLKMAENKKSGMEG
ncbi:MAG: DNA repair protein RecN [Halanaerobiales bacterium]